ncbi:MAG: hypothetical protein A2Y33_13600 [Spirochaetes bacterium GWF1_51_8]|nr:MAG: hypothetical protein A2Y33_13600 [Spirochaetes bacterium GWF1_51_8]
MNFLHTSDLHLRDKDSLETLRIVLGTAEREDCGYILIAGDMFDNAQAPLALEGAISDMFEKYGGFIYIIPGNHDLGFLKGIERLSKNSEVLNTGSFFLEREMDGVELWGVPYKDKTEFSDIGKIPADPGNSVVMLHGSFYDNKFFYGMDEKKYMPVFMEEIDGLCRYTAMGHYHGAREWKTRTTTAVYPGAPAVTSSADLGRRAVYVTGSDWQTRRIDLPVEYMHAVDLAVNIGDNAASVPEKLEALLASVEDRDRARLIVRVRGTMPPSFTSADTLKRVVEDTLNRSKIKYEPVSMEGVTAIAPGLTGHSFVESLMREIELTAPEKGLNPTEVKMYAIERLNSMFVK